MEVYAARAEDEDEIAFGEGEGMDVARRFMEASENGCGSGIVNAENGVLDS